VLTLRGSRSRSPTSRLRAIRSDGRRSPRRRRRGCAARPPRPSYPRPSYPRSSYPRSSRLHRRHRGGTGRRSGWRRSSRRGLRGLTAPDTRRNSWRPGWRVGWRVGWRAGWCWHLSRSIPLATCLDRRVGIDGRTDRLAQGVRKWVTHRRLGASDGTGRRRGGLSSGRASWRWRVRRRIHRRWPNRRGGCASARRGNRLRAGIPLRSGGGRSDRRVVDHDTAKDRDDERDQDLGSGGHGRSPKSSGQSNR
jgi:hypothetical protein